MGLDVWFREDVIRILSALASAGSQRGPEYQQALYDVALAFGIVLPNDCERGSSRRQPEQLMGGGRAYPRL